MWTFSPQYAPSRFFIVSPQRLFWGCLTHDHKPEGFKPEKRVLSVLESGSRSHGVGRAVLPLEAAGAGILPASSSFGGLLASCGLWPPPSASAATWPLLRMCVLSSFYKKRAHTGARPDPIRPPYSLATHLFPNKVTFRGFGQMRTLGGPPSTIRAPLLMAGSRPALVDSAPHLLPSAFFLSPAHLPVPRGIPDTTRSEHSVPHRWGRRCPSPSASCR